jgi:putative chitinase
MIYRRYAQPTCSARPAMKAVALLVTRENLNYSPEGMCRVWPSRFKTVAEAEAVCPQSQRLWQIRFTPTAWAMARAKGMSGSVRGFLQLTGKDNYKSFASDMRVPEIMQDPSLVETDYAFETALWFFEKNNLFAIADKGVNDDTIKQITKRVNGGYIGLDHRMKETQKIWSWLNG